jgi:hypothetical protein
VVWQRDDGGRYSIYYAHLHEPLVRRGQQVLAGDTVGLVGNTGNARTTPPHLHFGAYRRGRGAVDPWDLILPQPPPLPAVALDPRVVGEWGRVASGDARLRSGPSVQGAVMDYLPEEAPVRVLAATGEWYRVLLADGRSGYVDGGLVEASGGVGTWGDGHQ